VLAAQQQNQQCAQLAMILSKPYCQTYLRLTSGNPQTNRTLRATQESMDQALIPQKLQTYLITCGRCARINCLCLLQLKRFPQVHMQAQSQQRHGLASHTSNKARTADMAMTPKCNAFRTLQVVRVFCPATTTNSARSTVGPAQVMTTW